jgi:[ribosomal protein S5]-alanine N-acetyltransferase
MTDIVFETPRLLHRRLSMDDLDDLARICADPEVRRYYPEGVLTYDQTREELEWFINVYYARYGYGLWATIDRASGLFIGRCGLIPWTRDGQLQVEVAYMLARPFWGRGLGTEAAIASRDYGFNVIGLPRLICLLDPRNTASANIARKMGMALLREEVETDGSLTWVFGMERPKG